MCFRMWTLNVPYSSKLVAGTTLAKLFEQLADSIQSLNSLWSYGGEGSEILLEAALRQDSFQC